MTDGELKALEALIGHRLSAGELDHLRAAAARTQARAMLDLRFAMAIERYREANPAAIAPHMGFA